VLNKGALADNNGQHVWPLEMKRAPWNDPDTLVLASAYLFAARRHLAPLLRRGDSETSRAFCASMLISLASKLTSLERGADIYVAHSATRMLGIFSHDVHVFSHCI